MNSKGNHQQNEGKKLPVKYEKRFANNAVDKRLITKIYIQFIQLNLSKEQQQQQKTESKNEQKA